MTYSVHQGVAGVGVGHTQFGAWVFGFGGFRGARVEGRRPVRHILPLFRFTKWPNLTFRLPYKSWPLHTKHWKSKDASREKGLGSTGLGNTLFRG